MPGRGIPLAGAERTLCVPSICTQLVTYDGTELDRAVIGPLTPDKLQLTE